MLSAIATWFAGKGAALLLGAAANFVLGYVNDRNKEAALREAGAAEAASATNRETANAERRASDAAINASAGTALDDDLASGRREF